MGRLKNCWCGGGERAEKKNKEKGEERSSKEEVEDGSSKEEGEDGSTKEEGEEGSSKEEEESSWSVWSATKSGRFETSLPPSYCTSMAL